MFHKIDYKNKNKYCMEFNSLVSTIKDTHVYLQQSLIKAVNKHHTLRNWVVGFYIIQYEQIGRDRTEYGSKLLENLAAAILIKGLTASELSRCRQFYKVYPEIFGTLSQKLKILGHCPKNYKPLI